MIETYLALFLVTSLYAYTLEHVPERFKPYETWIEVVIGTAICLLFTHLSALAEPPRDWQDFEVRTWIAFAVGGTPIVAWQLWRSWEMFTTRISYRTRKDTAPHADPAEEMAEEYACAPRRQPHGSAGDQAAIKGDRTAAPQSQDTRETTSRHGAGHDHGCTGGADRDSGSSRRDRTVDDTGAADADRGG